MFFFLVHGEKIAETYIAKKILSDLNEEIKSIRSAHSSFKGMRYEFGLECDLCREKTDNKCDRHKVNACSNGDCVHIRSLDELKKPPVSCTKDQSGSDFSKLHECMWVKETGKTLFLIRFLMSVTVEISWYDRMNGLVGWVDGWLVCWLDEWLVGWLDGGIVRWMDGWTDGWMDGRTYGRTDGWMVGWLVGWTDGRMVGWMVGYFVLIFLAADAEYANVPSGEEVVDGNSAVGKP